MTDGAIKISVWLRSINHLPTSFMLARHEGLINLTAIYKENYISLIAPINIQNLNTKSNNL